MPHREIILYGNPILREAARPVEGLTPEVEALAEDMKAMMREHGGVGLAANQVGETLRVIVVDMGLIESADRNKPTSRPEVFYNPEVQWQSDEDDRMNEGCLSFPDIRIEIYRPVKAKIRARDAAFEPVEFDADGLLAEVFQHEIDHLDGVLFIDHLSKVRRMGLAGKLRRVRLDGEAQARHAAVASGGETRSETETEMGARLVNG